jgi:hypothetical protein
VKRVSHISDPNDFDTEHRRETLRDRRWHRRQSIIFSIASGIALVLLALEHDLKVPALPF